MLCSQLVPQEFAFEALMHDATEAYCRDIPRHWNDFFLTINGWKKNRRRNPWEIRVTPVMSTPVKYADLIMLATERRDPGFLMMALSGLYWKASRQQRCSKLFHCHRAMPTGCLWNVLTSYRSYANAHECFRNGRVSSREMCTARSESEWNKMLSTRYCKIRCAWS